LKKLLQIARLQKSFSDGGYYCRGVRRASALGNSFKMLAMEMPHYPILMGEDHLNYSFFSYGPKGRILKSIWFEPLQFEPRKVFNLILRDIDLVTRNARADVVSNNGDRNKVLSTVARSVAMLLGRYPTACVIARGNSPARTRLYRMMISNHLEKIQIYFPVYGLAGIKVEGFRKNQNYDGFMVRSRKFLNDNNPKKHE
jgi:hypothetical protein